MARNGKWPARIALAVSAAMVATLFTVLNASGQSGSTAGLPTVGVDVQTASITQATYAIVVRNQGDAPSTNVRVRSRVPTNTTFESSDPAPTTTTSPGTGAQSCGNGGVRETDDTTCEWNLGTLNPGDVRTIAATYNLNQTNVATYRVVHQATVSDGEGHNNSDLDESLVREQVTISDDTWVDDQEPPNTNHGTCTYLRVLQGNRITSYLEADTFGTGPSAANGQATTTLETLYGAQLRAEVLDTSYTEAAPGVIGAHRIVSGDWAEGPGNCPGGAGSDNQPRAGFEPTSNSGATATAEIRSAPAITNWNVTADLDSPEDRGGFNGWELRDATAAAGENFTRFHSTEAAAAQQPRLFLVYTTAESPTCLDADPETATAGVGSEHVMTVFVTDGARTPTPTNAEGSTTGPGGDACNGAPVAAAVEWEVQDDDPDIYFSSQEGTGIPKTISGNNATPNTIETTADQNGVTFAGVRLNTAPAPNADRTNVIEARLEGTEETDPDPVPDFPPMSGVNPCDRSPLPDDEETNCSGETEQIDDVSVTWGQQSGSGTTGSSTTGSPSGTTASPSGSQTTTASPSGSQTTSSPSGSATTSRPPSGTTGTSSSPQQSSRNVSLFASTNEVVFPGQVTLSGTITSPDGSCEDAGEFVRIDRRILGQSDYSLFETRNTDADGRFELSFNSTQSAQYIATATAHDNCAEATSSPQTVTVKVKITARSGRRSVPRGQSVGIVGRVQPDHDGTTVLLQRRRGSRWVTIDRDELNVRSRYRFVVDANWRGRRVFRTLWRSQDEEHETNNSKRVVIRARRPS
ncbi:MAG TPA: hypothetical protein VHN37_12375 [Actinomycetota bacterium]|nr:hypothetical protein [Actinomycetota bacterium]